MPRLAGAAGRVAVSAGLLACVAGAISPALADDAVARASPPAVVSTAAEDGADQGLVGPPPPAERTVAADTSASERAAARLDLALVATGQLADVVSTELALSRPGFRESNPLVRERAIRIGLKAGVVAGLSVACHELRKRNKPGHARLLAIVGFSVGAAAAVHNVRTMQK